MWRYGDALRLGYPDLSDGEFWILPPLGMSRGIHFFFRIFHAFLMTFANNHVYVCVWPPECGNFFYCGVVRFQPLAGPDRGPFFCCGLVGLQPLAGTYSIIFAQLFDSKCAYVPGSIHISNFDHNS